MKQNTNLGVEELAIALDTIPIGITIIDLDGHILYYNEYCSRYVDRKPEYIGKNIKSCHKKKKTTYRKRHFLSLKMGIITYVGLHLHKKFEGEIII